MLHYSASQIYCHGIFCYTTADHIGKMFCCEIFCSWYHSETISAKHLGISHPWTHGVHFMYNSLHFFTCNVHLKCSPSAQSVNSSSNTTVHWSTEIVMESRTFITVSRLITLISLVHLRTTLFIVKLALAEVYVISSSECLMFLFEILFWMQFILSLWLYTLFSNRAYLENANLKTCVASTLKVFISFNVWILWEWPEFYLLWCRKQWVWLVPSLPGLWRHSV